MKNYLLLVLLSAFCHDSWAQGTETFTNIPTSSSTSYSSRTWIGDGGISWTAESARTDQTINGKAITLNRSTAAYLESGIITGGIGNLTITTQRKYTGGTGDLLVIIIQGSVYDTVGVIPYSDSVLTTSINGINLSGNFNMYIKDTLAQNRIAIDDITWTSYGAVSCSIYNVSTSSFCDSNDAKLIVNFQSTGGSGTWQYSLDSQNYSNIISGDTITFMGPTTSATGLGLILRDATTANCSDTSIYSVIECPRQGGTLLFQMMNPCGYDGDNEFVAFQVDGNTDIDDIALGSLNDSMDTDWNFYWSTANSNINPYSINPTTTSTATSYTILDPSIPADNDTINARIAELNAAAAPNTQVFQAIPSSGIIPAGSYVVFFLAGGSAAGFDTASINLAFSDTSYNQKMIYALFGSATGSGYFSNSSSRTQFLSVNGVSSAVTYLPISGSPMYAIADGSCQANGNCIPGYYTLTQTPSNFALSDFQEISIMKNEHGPGVLVYCTYKKNENFRNLLMQKFNFKTNAWMDLGFMESYDLGFKEVFEAQDMDINYGLNQYRIQALFTDGSYEFSQVIPYYLNSTETELKAFIGQDGRLVISSPSESKAELQIINLMGQKVERHALDLVKGIQSIPILTDKLSEAGYIIRIETPNDHISLKYWKP